MYFATLGYDSNPLIQQYRSAFLQKLENLWRTQIGGGVLSSDFLLLPDIHSRLLTYIRPIQGVRIDYRKQLQEEYMRFKVNGTLQNQDEKVYGTNISITLDFHNPEANNYSHPDHKKSQVCIGFGNKNLEEWKGLFTKSFDIVRSVSPGCMSEIEDMIRQIIPFGVSEGAHNSGSYSDAIGHLLMSYPTGVESPEIAVLEAILHEYNHNKINLIMQTETLILNDRREMYYSPYRPDARHIHGIYLGLHAIAGAYWVIWNAHISGVITLSNNWQQKAVLYVLKNGLSLQVLDSYGSFSPLGYEILEEMRSVHRECLDMIKKSQLSPAIVAHAKVALISHFQSVKQIYPGLQF